MVEMIKYTRASRTGGSDQVMESERGNLCNREDVTKPNLHMYHMKHDTTLPLSSLVQMKRTGAWPAFCEGDESMWRPLPRRGALSRIEIGQAEQEEPISSQGLPLADWIHDPVLRGGIWIG